MPKRTGLAIVRRASWGYVGLPRRRICIRAVHHIFHPKNEPQEANSEELPVPWRCAINVRATSPFEIPFLEGGDAVH